MKTFKEYIHESIIDPLRPHFSPQVFVDPYLKDPIIKSEILDAIRAGVKKIENKFPVKRYVLIGSILTKRYNDQSDIDVNVQITKGDIEKAREFVSDINGKNAPGTQFPINYHIVTNDKDYDVAIESADAAYDIDKNKFIKHDTDAPFTVQKYWGAFERLLSKINFLKDELTDDVVDYSQLKKFKRIDLHKLKKLLSEKIKDLEEGAQDLVDLYDKIKQDRRDVYNEPLTTAEIREYGTKSRLPENVIYKLLERHSYFGFLKKIDDILGPDDKLSKEEADELEKFILSQ